MRGCQTKTSFLVYSDVKMRFCLDFVRLQLENLFWGFCPVCMSEAEDYRKIVHMISDFFHFQTPLI